MAASADIVPIDVISHEVLHAQYFTSDEYRAVIDQYWQDVMLEPTKMGDFVLTQEAQEILDILGEYYQVDESPEGQLLLKNEFQAYILMAGAELSLLADYVAKHRSRIISQLLTRQKELADQGITLAIEPIQVR